MASLSPVKLLFLYATIAVGSTLQHRYAARDCVRALDPSITCEAYIRAADTAT